jgi:hypothetical protein
MMTKMTLREAELHKWVKNLIIFLSPVGVLYLTTITGVISQPNHVFSFQDLFPNSFAQGGIVLWFLNAALDYLRKLRG